MARITGVYMPGSEKAKEKSLGKSSMNFKAQSGVQEKLDFTAKQKLNLVEGKTGVKAPILTPILSTQVKVLNNGCTEIRLETNDQYFYAVITRISSKNKKNIGKKMGG